MTPRDLENIDVSAAFFDANDTDVETARINIPNEVLERYQPQEMEIQGPFDDGSFLVGLRLIPKTPLVYDSVDGYIFTPEEMIKVRRKR